MAQATSTRNPNIFRIPLDTSDEKKHELGSSLLILVIHERGYVRR